MEMGYTTDTGRSVVPLWVEGEAERSLVAGLKTKGKRILHIDSLRCVDCGFVANMANRKWEPGKK